MSPEPLLTKAAAAAILGYHPQTLMRLVREHKFPKPLKASGAKSAVRFRASDISTWIEQRINCTDSEQRVAP